LPEVVGRAYGELGDFVVEVDEAFDDDATGTDAAGRLAYSPMPPLSSAADFTRLALA
jgi:hypothetical protein